MAKRHAALALVLLLVLVTGHWFVRTVSGSESTEVIVATRDIPSGATITADSAAAVLLDHPPGEPYATRAEVEAGVVAIRDIPAGRVVTRADVQPVAAASSPPERDDLIPAAWLLASALIIAVAGVALTERRRSRRSRHDPMPSRNQRATDRRWVQWHTANRVSVGDAPPPTEDLTATERSTASRPTTGTARVDLGIDRPDRSVALLDERAGAALDSGAVAADEPEVGRWEWPRVVLRVFGQVRVDGASVTQAVAVPYLVSAAGRPIGAAEISALTGYSPKTLSTSLTSAHPVLDRTAGQLVLGERVWTDHGWIAECVRRAASTMVDGPTAESAQWLRTALLEAGAIEGGPYERTPGNQRRWEWVDEFPIDVSTRAKAGQELVETVLLAVELWKVSATESVIPLESVVDMCCRLAQLVPYAAVARSVRPSGWRSAAECLLVTAFEVATAAGAQPSVHGVQTAARRLVANNIIDPSDEVADALGL